MSPIASLNRHQRRRTRLTVLALYLLTPCLLALPGAPAHAEDLTGLDAHFDRLSPPASPTKVKIGVYLLGISKVSEPKEPFPFFVAETFLEARWHDARLAFDPDVVGVDRKVLHNGQVTEAFGDMWWPAITIENERQRRHIENRELTILPDGTVQYDERFNAELHADLDLRRFPFDQQTFRIVIESFAWNNQRLQFEVDAARSGHAPDLHSMEWDVRSSAAHVADRKEIRAKHAFSAYTLEVKVDRRSGYYLWKLIVPLLIISLLTWTTFWMTGEPAGTRMQRCFIAVLSVVAFHRVVADSQPRISYLSFIDGIVYLVFFLCFASIVQVVFTHIAAQRNRPDVVRKLDVAARIAFPLVLGGVYTALWFLAH